MGDRGSQPSHLATSSDGLEFNAVSGSIAGNYLRAFKFRGVCYLLGMPGVLFRSTDWLQHFEPRDRLLFGPDMRHAGVWLNGSTLYVFWSRVGDAPERILVSTVDLSDEDWVA